MAGFLRSLFYWNNVNSSKTPYRRTNMNGPINLYRRTNLNNPTKLWSWHNVNSPNDQNNLVDRDDPT
jgi:hypothetical protein